MVFALKPEETSNELVVDAIMLDPISIMLKADGITCANEQLLALLIILTCPDKDIKMQTMPLDNAVKIYLCNSRIYHCLLFHDYGKQNFVQPFLPSRKLLRLHTCLD